MISVSIRNKWNLNVTYTEGDSPEQVEEVRIYGSSLNLQLGPKIEFFYIHDFEKTQAPIAWRRWGSTSGVPITSTDGNTITQQFSGTPQPADGLSSASDLYILNANTVNSYYYIKAVVYRKLGGVLTLYYKLTIGTTTNGLYSSSSYQLEPFTPYASRIFRAEFVDLSKPEFSGTIAQHPNLVYYSPYWNQNYGFRISFVGPLPIITTANNQYSSSASFFRPRVTWSLGDNQYYSLAEYKVNLNSEFYSQNYTFTLPTNELFNQSISTTLKMTMLKGAQTISPFPAGWSNLNVFSRNIMFFNGTRSSAGLPITYTVSDPTIATISSDSNNVSLSAKGDKVGNFSITATQAGNALYHAAPPIVLNTSIKREPLVIQNDVYNYAHASSNIKTEKSFYYLNESNTQFKPIVSTAASIPIVCKALDPSVADFSGQINVNTTTGSALPLSLKTVGTFRIQCDIPESNIYAAAQKIFTFQVLPSPRFAVLGNICAGAQDQASPNRSRFNLVAEAIKNLDTNITHIISAGNTHEGTTTSINSPAYYGNYITNNISTNRFFPCLGKHDWDNLSFYFSNFPILDTLIPNRTSSHLYTVKLLNKFNFIFADSDLRQNQMEGTFKESVQAKKIINSLSTNSSDWNILVFSDSPFSSAANYTPADWMRWTCEESSSNIDLVICGDAKNFEIFNINGRIVANSGGSGKDLSPFKSPNPAEYSIYRNNELGYLVINQSEDGAALYFSKVKVNENGTISESVIKDSRGNRIEAKRYYSKSTPSIYSSTVEQKITEYNNETNVIPADIISQDSFKYEIEKLDPQKIWVYQFKAGNLTKEDSISVRSSNPEVLSIHPDSFRDSNIESDKPFTKTADAIVSNQLVTTTKDFPIKFNILKPGSSTLIFEVVRPRVAKLTYTKKFEFFGRDREIQSAKVPNAPHRINSWFINKNYYASSPELGIKELGRTRSWFNNFPVYTNIIDGLIDFPFDKIINIENILVKFLKNKKQNSGKKALYSQAWAQISEDLKASSLILYNSTDKKIELKQLTFDYPQKFDFNYYLDTFNFSSALDDCVINQLKFNLNGLNWKSLITTISNLEVDGGGETKQFSNAVQNINYKLKKSGAGDINKSENFCSNALFYSKFNKNLNIFDFEVSFYFKNEKIDSTPYSEVPGEGCYFFLGDWRGNSTPQNYDSEGIYVYDGELNPSLDCSQNRWKSNLQYPLRPNPGSGPDEILGSSKGYRFEINSRNNSVGIYFNGQRLNKYENINIYSITETLRNASGNVLEFDLLMKNIPDKKDISNIELKFREGTYSQILTQEALTNALAYNDNSNIDKVPTMGDFICTYGWGSNRTGLNTQKVPLKSISSKMKIPIILTSVSTLPNRFVDVWVEVFFRDGSAMKSKVIRLLENANQFTTFQANDGERYVNTRIDLSAISVPRINLPIISTNWNFAKISCEKGFFNVYINNTLAASFQDINYFRRIEECGDYFGLGIYGDPKGKGLTIIKDYIFNKSNMLSPDLNYYPTLKIYPKSEVCLNGLNNLNQIYIKSPDNTEVEYKYSV